MGFWPKPNFPQKTLTSFRECDSTKLATIPNLLIRFTMGEFGNKWAFLTRYTHSGGKRIEARSNASVAGASLHASALLIYPQELIREKIPSMPVRTWHSIIAAAAAIPRQTRRRRQPGDFAAEENQRNATWWSRAT